MIIVEDAARPHDDAGIRLVVWRPMLYLALLLLIAALALSVYALLLHVAPGPRWPNVWHDKRNPGSVCYMWKNHFDCVGGSE